MIQTLFGTAEQEPNLFERLKMGIQKTRRGLLDHLDQVFAGKKEIDAELLEELEFTSEAGPRPISSSGSARGQSGATWPIRRRSST